MRSGRCAASVERALGWVGRQGALRTVDGPVVRCVYVGASNTRPVATVIIELMECLTVRPFNQTVGICPWMWMLGSPLPRQFQSLSDIQFISQIDC